MRKLLLGVCVAAVACSHGARKDVTPPLAEQAPEAAAAEAARRAGAPPLTHDEIVTHALSRVTFGPSPADRARIERLGVAAFIEEQLHPEALDDAALEARLDKYPALHRDTASRVQELVETRRMNAEKQRAQAAAQPQPPAPQPQGPLTAAEAAQKLAAPAAPKPPAAPAAPARDLKKPMAPRGPGFDYVAQLSEAKLLRAVSSQRQLQEVMTDFWFNHFNVFAGKEQESALLPEYEQLLRANALGSFPELLEAVAHSPAMLIYLDNWRSVANNPRPRRYARWPRPGPRPDAASRPQRGLNENYARELLELHTMGVDGGYTQQDIIEVARCFTGWTVDEPQRDPRFIFRAQAHDDGVKNVLGHTIPAGGERDAEEVLRILEQHPSTARFISTKLVRRFVSDDPPPALVERVAATYARTQGDLRSMLRTIFESPELWSRAALHAKVRSPLELVAASVRAFGAQVDDPAQLARAVARIGEPLYAAQPPTGYGDTAQQWLSPGALLSRIDFGLQLANGQLAGVKVSLAALPAREPEALVQSAAQALGAPELSEKTRAYILQQLREASPAPDVQTKRAVGLLLGAPELQRR